MFTLVLLRIIAVLLLVALNAFFVAAEFALVSVRDTRLEQLIEQGRTGARTVRKLHHNLDEVLNGVQLGITIASLALGWVGEAAFAGILQQAFHGIPYAAAYAHTIAVIIAFGTITYMHVILGEVVPKSVALQSAERVALAVAGPMDVFMRIAHPALALMNASARVALRALGTRQVGEGGAHSAEELKLLATSSRRRGSIAALQEEMIHRALDLESVTVREVMVPRPDIFSLPSNLPLDEALTKVVEEQHSRIPIYDAERGPEAIIGVLYAKDLMRWMHYRAPRGRSADEPIRRQPTLYVRHLMRDVLIVPETKPLPDLLVDFKKRKKHLAVVVDEFGSTAGVVSVEDVLEQLVGEIEDEFDVPSQALIAGTSVTLDGATNIRDLETQFHIELPRDEGFESLGGFVITQLQRIPRVGDAFEYEGRRYTVKGMDGRRVEAVKIELITPPQQPASEGADAESA